MKSFWYIFLLSLCLALSCGCAARTESQNIWFIVRGTNNEIRTLNTVTGQQRVVLSSGAFLHDARLSPDGKHILYITIPDQDTFVPWLANSDGSTPTEIRLDFGRGNVGFVWLNNKQILFGGLKKDWTGHPDAPFLWQLYDVESRETQKLIWNTPDSRNPNFIYYNPEATVYKPRDEPVVIFGHIQVNQDTVHQFIDVQVDSALLPPRVGGGTNASAATDGKVIAFGGLGGSNNYDVFLATDSGHSVQQLTHFEQEYGVSSLGQLALSPDGKWIIFDVTLGMPHKTALPNDGQLALVSANGNMLKFLREQPGGIYGVLKWSANSRDVALCIVPLDVDPNKSACEIHLIDIESGKIEQITSDGFSKSLFDWR